jgi:diadenosine tetraphosphate (Ap4A) HIT family hydrolase
MGPTVRQPGWLRIQDSSPTSAHWSRAAFRNSRALAVALSARAPRGGELPPAPSDSARIFPMTGARATDCFVCRKHQDRGALMPGGPIADDDLVVVSHVVPPDVLGGSGSTAYLGHLFVEPRRHTPGLADLTDEEARAVGWWCTRVSRALRHVVGAEHVYAAVFGDGVPHLHVHLLARLPGTPREYWGVHVNQWPEARRGDAAEIELLVRALRRHLAAT